MEEEEEEYAEMYASSRRFVRLTPGFLQRFEYQSPCELCSLRQLHGPLTQSEMLRSAINECARRMQRVVIVLYTGQSMRPLGLIVELSQVGCDIVRMTCEPLEFITRRVRLPKARLTRVHSPLASEASARRMAGASPTSGVVEK